MNPTCEWCQQEMVDGGACTVGPAGRVLDVSPHFNPRLAWQSEAEDACWLKAGVDRAALNF